MKIHPVGAEHANGRTDRQRWRRLPLFAIFEKTAKLLWNLWRRLKEVKQSLYRPGQTLRVPGGWSSQISWQSAHEGGRVVSPTPRRLVLLSVTGWVDPRPIVAAWKIMSMKNPNNNIGNRNRNLMVCSALSEPAAPPRAPCRHVRRVLEGPE